MQMYKLKFVYIGGFTLLTYVIWRIYINPYKIMSDCIFCNIINGKTKTIIEKETEDIAIFKDINPASTYHYLAVPKKHIESLEVMTKNDIQIIDTLDSGLRNFMQTKGINLNDSLLGFHKPPFISVKHLHLHGIAPKTNMPFIKRITFQRQSFWFKQVEEAKQYLRSKS